MESLTEQKKIETTVLIAEFMGYEVIPYQGNVYKPIYNGHKHAKIIGEQKKLWNGLSLHFTGRFTECVEYPFDTDFSYLIPIIREIEELGYIVNIAGIKYQIYRLNAEQEPIVSLVCGDLSQKTRMAYELIIEFLKTLRKYQTI